MNLAMHPEYAALIDKAAESHRCGRTTEDFTGRDIDLARMYCYALRTHSIGAFHATAEALKHRPVCGAEAMVQRRRALEALGDLQDQAMDPVPCDFRAVISTLHRYHRNIVRALDAMAADSAGIPIAQRFAEIMNQITGSNGLHVASDTEAPPQACFTVPNLHITIVPLVYGDHHSWNLAYLPEVRGGVPIHRHRHGVEIHLGYEPLNGSAVLGGFRTAVREGYAMPIPPGTAHGYLNAGGCPHHVPFVFGSLRHGGWGVFFDVEPVSRPVAQLLEVPRRSPQFNQMIYLQREIARACELSGSRRWILIPASTTNREGSGGLELAIARINQSGFAWPSDEFRIVSVVNGRGMLTVAHVSREVGPHDHFGIPAGMKASLRQLGHAPLVVLDCLIRSASSSR